MAFASACLTGSASAAASASVAARQASEAAGVIDELLLASAAAWDAERLREIGNRLDGMPPQAQAQALWLAAQMPERHGVTDFLTRALSSSSPSVRRQAADILVSRDTPETTRLVADRLHGETDGETIRHLVGTLANRLPEKAVPVLMELMLRKGASPELQAAAARELRGLTQTTLPDRPGDWRDWWLENSHRY